MLLLACSSSNARPVTDPAALRKVEAELAKRDGLLEQLAAVSDDVKQKCEMLAGDCLMFVRDQRDELTTGRFFLECQTAKYTEEREECLLKNLARHGKAKEAIGFYSYHSSCIDEMLKCTKDLEQKRAAEIQEAMYHQRKLGFEGAPELTELRLEVAIVGEKVKYVRSTLPPAADDICKELPAIDECWNQVEQHTQKFEAELIKPESKYDQAAAQRLFEERNRTELSCAQPELDCITGKLGDYGANARSGKLLDRNFELVARRHRLVAKATPRAAEECLAAGIARHQALIIAHFRNYVKQTIPYFRIQLQRTFLTMHRFQVECLEQHVK
jgi:hypothetical protein